MQRLLEGKIALITGGTSGIGLATAEKFVNEGAYVFITGRDAAKLKKAEQQIGHDVTALQGDVADMEDLEKIFTAIHAQKGKLDIVFANAAAAETSMLENITTEHYYRVFDTNVKGTIFTVQRALPLLSDGASIILTASKSAVKGRAGFSVYSASKAAIRNLARSWLLELKERHIRVNVISPGSTATQGLGALSGSPENVEAFFNILKERVPLGRMGQPHEIAAVVAFMASEGASFMNGADIQIDGGEAQI